MELKRSGYTVIYTTNSIDEILLSDRILILNDGEIAEDFSKSEILEKIDKFDKYKIEIPEIVRIVHKLRNAGISINLQNWTMSELVDKLVGDKL